jgi:glycosyltransferase involved in cell wall biosynthesis
MKKPITQIAVTLTSQGRGGISSVVAMFEQDGVFERWNMRTVHTHVEGRLFKRLLTAFKALSYFSCLMIFKQVSFVHCHVAMKGSFWRKSLFSRVALLFGVPVVFHVHGGELKKFYNRQHRIVKKIISNQLACVTAVIVLSESWKDFVSEISPTASITVVPNYVGIPPLTECRKAHEGIRVVFLGVLRETKGIYDLLDAFALIAPSVPNMQLYLGGEGEIDQVKVAVDKHRLESRVHILGWVSGASKTALFEYGDIYVLPSHHEGLPMSVLEAMSWGLPVISTKVGAVPEVVRDKVDGILIEPRDISALAQALLQLGESAEQRQRLGQSARQVIEKHFSRDAAIPRLETVYADLTKSRNV